MGQDVIQPDQRTEVATPPGAEEQGLRRCEACGTRLSSYNPGPNCWQHTIGHPWRGPHAKPKS